jgi:hypothetical protein
MPNGYELEHARQGDGRPAFRWRKGNLRSGLIPTPDEAQQRAERHHKSQQKRVRKCLNCPDDFESEGIHNRLCPRCRRHPFREWWNN